MKKSSIQTKRQYLEEYNRVFRHDSKLTVPSEDTLRRYRVQVMSYDQIQQRQQHSGIRLVYVGSSAYIAIYEVDLGRFRFTIKLLIVPGCADKVRGIGSCSGSFGDIILHRVASTEFVAKLVHTSITNIEEIIYEATISKLCAMYEVAPDVQTSIPFDIIAYDDAYQFHLERCRPIANSDRSQRIVEDIRHCIEVMHSLQIVHKDIKEANILWCQRLRRFVLCDFGVAEYVAEGIGFVSETIPAGTVRYMGPEMRLLIHSCEGKGLVDLYYNDLYAWRLLSEYNESPRHSHAYSCSFSSTGSDELSIYQSESVKSEKVDSNVLISSMSIASSLVKPNNYEFYRLFHAATDLYEHNFSFQQNLPIVSVKQQQTILNILTKSLNRPKIQQALSELKSLTCCHLIQWEAELRKAYQSNFDDHMPKKATVPSITTQYIGNLRRIGFFRGLPRHAQRRFEGESHQFSYQKVVEEVHHKIYSQFDRCQRDIIDLFQNRNPNLLMTTRQLFELIRAIRQMTISYDSKLYVMCSIRSSFKQMNIRDEFFDVINSVFRGTAHTEDLKTYCEKESSRGSIQKCLVVVSSCRSARDFSPHTTLPIILLLLSKLTDHPEVYFMEITFLLRLRCEMELMVGKSGYESVLSVYGECIALMKAHGRYSTGREHVELLRARLMLFIRFAFPQQIVKQAHLQFEQVRQFYEEICVIDANESVNNFYRAGTMPVHQANPIAEELALFRLIETMQTFSFRLDILEKHYGMQYPQRDDSIQNALQHAHILIRLGRHSETEELQFRVKRQAAALKQQASKFHYHYLRALIQKHRDKPIKVQRHIAKAIAINNRMYPTANRQYVNGIFRYLLEIPSDRRGALRPRVKLREAWSFLEQIRRLEHPACDVVFRVLALLYKQNVGNQIFGFINYVQKRADIVPQLQALKKDTDQTSRPVLPLDMPISTFIEEAETCLRQLPKRLHSGNFLYKHRLLRLLRCRFADYPQFRLIYVRILVQTCLHYLLGGGQRGLASYVLKVIMRITETEVVEEDSKDKAALLQYCQSLSSQVRYHSISRRFSK